MRRLKSVSWKSWRAERHRPRAKRVDRRNKGADSDEDRDRIKPRRPTLTYRADRRIDPEEEA